MPHRTRARPRRRTASKTLLLGLMAVAAPLLLLLVGLGAAPGASAQPDTAGYRSGWTLSQFPNPSKVRCALCLGALSWLGLGRN